MKKVKESGAAFRKKRKMRIDEEARQRLSFCCFFPFLVLSCCPIILHIGARKRGRGGTVP